ncbi:MAG: hypothetical protein R2795_05610 [Saprospiraceae bacterium]
MPDSDANEDGDTPQITVESGDVIDTIDGLVTSPPPSVTTYGKMRTATANKDANESGIPGG